MRQITGTDDDHPVFMVDSEDLTEFFFQLFDRVSVSLPSESAKAIDILTNLRSRQTHPFTQFLRGNLDNAFFFQLSQMTVISG